MAFNSLLAVTSELDLGIRSAEERGAEFRISPLEATGLEQVVETKAGIF